MATIRRRNTPNIKTDKKCGFITVDDDDDEMKSLKLISFTWLFRKNTLSHLQTKSLYCTVKIPFVITKYEFERSRKVPI